MTKETTRKTSGEGMKEEDVRANPIAVKMAVDEAKTRMGSGAGKIVAVRRVGKEGPKQKTAGQIIAVSAKRPSSAKGSGKKDIVPDTKIDPGNPSGDGGGSDADKIISEGFGSRDQGGTQPGKPDVRKRKKKPNQ
jgi:hypothetical protein